MEPLVINLVNKEDDLEKITELVFTALMIQNEDNEITQKIAMSMWFEPEEWKFADMNYKKPNEGEVSEYMPKVVAMPRNMRYS